MNDLIVDKRIYPETFLNTCGICFEQLMDETTIDPGNDIITCNKCGLSFHHRCYGSGHHIPATFLCDRCIDPPPIDTICCICNSSEGYLKKILPSNWIHPICGLLVDNIEVINFGTMEMKVINEFQIQVNKSECEYCNFNNGQLLQCEYLKCNKNIHTFCAYRQRTMNPENSWQIDLDFGNDKAEAPYCEIFNYIETKEMAMEVKHETNEPHNRCGIMNNRGGKIRIYCSIHKDTSIKCICKSEKNNIMNDNDFTVRCNYCGKKYHNDCIGAKFQSEVPNNYTCDNCKHWETAKKSYLLNQLKDTSFNWKYPIFPASSNKLSDILLISEIFSVHGELMLKSTCNILILYNHLKDGIEIPMQFQTIMENLKAKIESAIKLDKENENILNEHTILQIIDDKYNLIEENINVNGEIQELLQAKINKYDSEIKVHTRFFDNIKKNVEVLNSLKEISAKFFNFMEFDEASTHLNKLEGSDIEFTMEIQFLRDIISEYEQWESRLPKLERKQISDEIIFTENSIEEITTKINEIQDRLSTNITPEDVNELINEGSLHFIRKKIVLDILKKEKSLFEKRESLYSHFIKSGCTLDQFKSLIKEICEGFISNENDKVILKEYEKYLKISFVSKMILSKGILIDESNGKILKNECNFEDVEGILNKCNTMTIKALDSLKTLNERIEEVNKWKEEFKELVNKGESVETLHKCIIKAEEYKLHLPEFDSVMSQVDAQKSIELFETSQEPISYDSLSQLISMAEYTNKLNISSMKSLFESAQLLVNESKELISLSATSYNEIEKIYKCIEAIKNQKVVIPNLEILEKIIVEYKLQSEIAGIVNVLPIENIDYLDIEKIPIEL